MTRGKVIGAAFVVVLIVVAVGVALRMTQRNAASARLQAADEEDVHPSFIYGRITTVEGGTYEGRLRWGGGEEAFWGDYFNGAKKENPWAGHVPVAMIFAANVVFGSGVAVWGTDAIGIVLVLASVVAAGAGFALVIASFAKNPDQGGSISTLVLTVSGLLGGAFLPVDDVPILGQLSKLTLNRWGLDGFTTLSFDGGTVMDILPNVAVLLGMAVVFFTIALFQFGRRFRS